MFENVWKLRYNVCRNVSFSKFINANILREKFRRTFLYNIFVDLEAKLSDEVGEAIRQYGRANPGKPIILQDELTGSMIYLKYGRKNARFHNI